MSINIRIAVPDDATAACQVLRRSILECCVQDHQHKPEILEAWLGNKTPPTIATWFSTPSNFSLVAERDGEIVGVALLTQAGKLSLCYVLPEVLHMGIGKCLLQGVEAQAHAWGISVIKLHSTTTASDFYARHGYINAGKERSCYGVETDFYWKKVNADLAEGADKRKRYCNCGEG